MSGVTADQQVDPDQEPPPTTGRWVFNILCCPFILLYHSIVIFFLPCLQTYIHRACCLLCCSLNCCRYTDKKFVAGDAAIGDWKGHTTAEVVWRRAREMKRLLDEKGRYCLFEHSVTPDDVAQGQLGDCWLLTAIACLAEFPGAIQHLFLTKEYHPRGKYRVRLYDAVHKQWEVITVDEFFPCDAKSDAHMPLFAQPHGREVWVLVLEKAFAKFIGSYGKLAGGHSLWALSAMTGDNVFKFMCKDDGVWERLNLVHYDDKTDKRSIGLRATDEKFKSLEMFHVIKKYDERRSVITAGSHGKGEAKTDDGIVQGHAYTIIGAVEKSNHRLLKMRNPWGSFEWKGDWSDSSDLWSKHSDVRKACKKQPGDKDDGVFWISWEDFETHFKSIDVCARSVNWKDIHLDIREEEGCCGPIKGCAGGCCRYWCLCQGTYALCCAKHTSNVTVK